jgi:hypothetical protein
LIAFAFLQGFQSLVMPNVPDIRGALKHEEESEYEDPCKYCREHSEKSVHQVFPLLPKMSWK